ncbi:MAG: hypothetical protein M3Y74_13850, partial [Chloroflexota bacterium]|nr:hypothetical protein [Chloroflexota bacterium]
MQPQSIRLVAVEPTPPESSGPADVSFEIENVGENDRHCVVAVAGLPAAWYALEPHDISLTPGTRTPLRLTVHPPQTALGRYPFTVSARPDDAKIVEALSFTLVVSTGGAARVYPGLVTMRAETAATGTTAMVEGVTPATRPALPRLLIMAAPLLLVLLLLGVALSKQSPHATRTAAAPVLSSTAAPLVFPPIATPVHRAGSSLGTPTATDVGTAAFGGAIRTPRPTSPVTARTATVAGTVTASGPPPTRPVPAATGMARAAQATRQSSAASPTNQPVQADVGQRQSTQAGSRQPPSTPIGATRPQDTPLAVARATPTSVTHPIVSSTSGGVHHTAANGVHHTVANKPIHSVAGAVRVHPPRRTHTNSNTRQVAAKPVHRQVAAKPVHKSNTRRRVAARVPATSRRRQSTQSSRRAQTGRSQAHHAVVTPRTTTAARPRQRRVIQHQP